MTRTQLDEILDLYGYGVEDKPPKGEQIMTRTELNELLDRYGIEDEDDFDITEILREQYERQQELVEEIEERQHNNGMYAQQDLIALYRYER